MSTATIETRPPAFNTGTLRYDFQISCTRRHAGTVLNVGSNEDPSKLRQTFGARVVNCDLAGYDEWMNRPNIVDRIFDCLDIPWPFEDDSADLVVFGDILEHFPVEQSIRALSEAHRVASNVCITVPEDTRIDEQEAREAWALGEYNLHTTVVTEDVLEQMLQASGWEPDWLVRGLWGVGGDWGEDGIYGWCAHARRGKDE